MDIKAVLAASQAHRPWITLWLRHAPVTRMRYMVADIVQDGFVIAARVLFCPPATPGGYVGIGRPGHYRQAKQGNISSRILSVRGDRTEPFGRSISAPTCTNPWRTSTGDFCGNIDDAARQPLPFRPYSLPGFSAKAARIEKMVEEPWRIHMVGSPALGRYPAEPTLQSDILSRSSASTWPSFYPAHADPVTSRRTGAAQMRKRRKPSPPAIPDHHHYPIRSAGGGSTR
jgi:hypothetical protein